MANIPVVHFYASGTLSIGADEYTAAIDSAMLTPTTPVTVFTDISGDSTPVAGKPTWVLGLSVAQDLITDGSLSLYLIEHAGEIKPVTFTPEEDGASFAVDVLIIPGAIGGAGGSLAKSTVNLNCAGQPAITPAP